MQKKQQSWLGAYTTKQLQDKQMQPTANHILKLRNGKKIRDIVNSVNRSIRQQILPNKSYQQDYTQLKITDTKCRMCGTATESSCVLAQRSYKVTIKQDMGDR